MSAASYERLDERVKVVEKTTDEHDELLNGNGKPGLKEDVSDMKRNHRLMMWFCGIVAGTSLATFVQRMVETFLEKATK